MTASPVPLPLPSQAEVVGSRHIKPRNSFLLGREATASSHRFIVGVFPFVARVTKQLEPPSIPFPRDGDRRLEEDGIVGEIEKTQLFHDRQTTTSMYFPARTPIARPFVTACHHSVTPGRSMGWKEFRVEPPQVRSI